MIFEKKELPRFELGGEKFPFTCDIAVLEKLQEAFGDLNAVDWKLRGFKPYTDQNGVVDMTKEGTAVTPDVKIVVSALYWMIQEGLDITGEEMEITEQDLKRQDEYTLLELAVIAWGEFNQCFLSKRKSRSKK